MKSMLNQSSERGNSSGGVRNNFGTVLIHPTAYDGCVELAGIHVGGWERRHRRASQICQRGCEEPLAPGEMFNTWPNINRS